MQPSHVSLWLRPDTPSEGEQEAFAKLKHILRKFGARTKEVLIEAMSQALRAVSTQDVRGFFAHCGYRTPAQQL
jgi:hypothetical protein